MPAAARAPYVARFPRGCIGRRLDLRSSEISYHMVDFYALDRDTRTAALVGQFLRHWADLENQIDRGIGGALGLTTLQRYVITKNLSFTYKLNVLGALFSVSLLSNDSRISAKLLLQEVKDISPK
jgi:hypothetical protein